MIAFAIVYSVMQSDPNSFCDDVVLDNINMEHRDEERILYQIYGNRKH